VYLNDCEHGNEPSGSLKGRDFLDQLTNYQLPKTHPYFRRQKTGSMKNLMMLIRPAATTK
jgi:hypothetical protein